MNPLDRRVRGEEQVVARRIKDGSIVPEPGVGK
jgi:hypothetical protein